MDFPDIDLLDISMPFANTGRPLIPERDDAARWPASAANAAIRLGPARTQTRHQRERETRHPDVAPVSPMQSAGCQRSICSLCCLNTRPSASAASLK